jgi:hypothetical protein
MTKVKVSRAMHFTLVRVCCFIALRIDDLSLSLVILIGVRPMPSVNNICAEYKAQEKTKRKNKRDLSAHDLHNEREDFRKANKGFASLNEICIAGLTNIFLGHVHTW